MASLISIKEENRLNKLRNSIPCKTNPSQNIDILYEDNWLLILNKPAGLPTQSTVDKNRENLYDLLRTSKQWSYLGLHHRLDVPTSGVILLTKSKSVNKEIAEHFKNKTIQKTYHCLISGSPEWDELKVENHLKAIKLKNGKSIMKAVTSGGDFAATTFKVIKRFNDRTLVEAQPHTGRMHQIRTHLAGIGYAILGDALYGKINKKIPRLMLHAQQLEFTHPISKKILCVTAEYPNDFLDQLC